MQVAQALVTLFGRCCDSAFRLSFPFCICNDDQSPRQHQAFKQQRHFVDTETCSGIFLALQDKDLLIIRTTWTDPSCAALHNCFRPYFLASLKACVLTLAAYSLLKSLNAYCYYICVSCDHANLHSTHQAGLTSTSWFVIYEPIWVFFPRISLVRYQGLLNSQSISPPR